MDQVEVCVWGGHYLEVEDCGLGMSITNTQ